MKKLISLILVLVCGVGCASNEGEPTEISDNFDRNAMLVNWADNIIIPSYENYVGTLVSLDAALTSFTSQSDLAGLIQLREKWLASYLAFQKVSMFEIGPAETLSLRNYTNVFPADTQEIEGFINSGEFNLSLPSTNDAQGFPALDYLLFGMADTDTEILNKISEAKTINFMSALVARLKSMSEEVLNEWKENYRDTFLANNGTTSSSSVNKLMNDFLYYYERSLRAGKIGIPAGVFSGSPLSNRVEGLYSQVYSKQLFNEALEATINFFTGKHFGSSSKGTSIEDYLQYLSEINSTEDLSLSIINQFEAAKLMAQQLKDNFFEQIETDNATMLKTYDELQKNVILMKVDMFQKMNVRIDYVDADGD